MIEREHPGLPAACAGGRADLLSRLRFASRGCSAGTRIILRAICSTLVLAACERSLTTALPVGSVARPAVSTVTLTPAAVSVTTGASAQLRAVAQDQYGNTINGAVFTWASADTATATVSSSGQVRGIAAGAVAITASSGGKYAAAIVSVTLAPPVVTSIALSPATVAVEIGATAQLSAAATDQYGTTMEGVTFIWASSNPATATVSASGVVTGVAAGTTAITAFSGATSGSATATVGVSAPDAITVTLSPFTATLAVGATQQLTATVMDRNGSPLIGQVTTWQSSDTTVASVSDSGLVTGIAAGTATISANVSGMTAASHITVDAQLPPPSASTRSGIWISQSEIMALPVSGAAWSNVKAAADATCGTPDLGNQDDPANVCVLAKALVYARTGGAAYRDGVLSALRSIATMGTYRGRALALGRELPAYVIAADIIGLATLDSVLDAQFRTKIDELRTTRTNGGPSTLIECHNQRPNNWGTHCGAARVAVALYLGDRAEFDRAVLVWRGWLGDRAAYSGFLYGNDRSWHSDPSRPVGIQPKGATKNGHDIDGVLAEEMRRCGSFQWPPCHTGYTWGATEGAIVSLYMMSRQGLPAFEWSDRALLRAFNWMYGPGNDPAVGDDLWQPHLLNHIYGTSFPTGAPANTGKNMAWTDWTHRGR